MVRKYRDATIDTEKNKSDRTSNPDDAVHFVHIVDDDQAVRSSLGDLLESMKYSVRLYSSASEFLSAALPDGPGCLVLDVRLPDTSGLELQEYLRKAELPMPIILMTGFGDIPMSVKSMKLGAVDFLTKPIRHQDLLDAISAAIKLDKERRRGVLRLANLREKYELLTTREKQVLALVASGLMNKQIANKLAIQEITVKIHRSSMMRKLETKSVATLAKIAADLNVDLTEV